MATENRLFLFSFPKAFYVCENFLSTSFTSSDEATPFPSAPRGRLFASPCFPLASWLLLSASSAGQSPGWGALSLAEVLSAWLNCEISYLSGGAPARVPHCCVCGGGSLTPFSCPSPPLRSDPTLLRVAWWQVWGKACPPSLGQEPVFMEGRGKMGNICWSGHLPPPLAHVCEGFWAWPSPLA